MKGSMRIAAHGALGVCAEHPWTGCTPSPMRETPCRRRAAERRSLRAAIDRDDAVFAGLADFFSPRVSSVIGSLAVHDTLRGNPLGSHGHWEGWGTSRRHLGEGAGHERRYNRHGQQPDIVGSAARSFAACSVVTTAGATSRDQWPWSRNRASLTGGPHAG